MKRRLFMIIMAIIMALTFVPASVLAATSSDADGNTPFDYVAIGDAATLGYGISGSKAYPALIKNRLANNKFNVKLDEIAYKGMRTTELRYLLDDTYADDDIYGGDDYLKENFSDLASKREAYKDSITKADMITIDLGAVDLGAYILYRAGKEKMSYDDPEVVSLVYSDPDNIRGDLRKEADNLLNGLDIVKDKLAENSIDIDQYIECAAYAYYSFYYNFDKSMELIKENNPDADIIVMGTRNMLDDLTVKLNIKLLLVKETRTVELGKMFDRNLILKANSHVKMNSDIYKYVDISDSERFLEEIKNYDRDPDSISAEFKNYCDVLEDDFHNLKSTAEKSIRAAYTAEHIAVYAKNINNGVRAAYDGTAQCMKNVAELDTIDINIDTTYIEGLPDLSEAGSDIMAGILYNICDKDSSVAVAIKGAKGKEYSALLGKFIGNLYCGKSGEVPADIGRVIMAFGMRTHMGDGFFQQPSVKGHTQIRDIILNAYSDKYLHFENQERSCTQCGVNEFWQNVVTGKCYSDPEFTQVVANKAGMFTKAFGHSWKENKRIASKDGVNGKSIQKCSRCQIEREITIPAKTRISYVSKGKKSFKVKWRYVKSATGYQLRYSKKHSMSGANTVRITSRSTLSKTVKYLKAKKKYYIQVRTYNKYDGKYYYAPWSARKSVITK